VGFIEKKLCRLPRPSKSVSRVIILSKTFFLMLTHYLSLIFLRAWEKFIVEKEGQFNPTITFYTDYLVRSPNNNFILIFF
jgi:hypothetical protein